MAKTRVRVIIEGIVQGVFFRQHTRRVAQGLGVTGWVKNRPDGTVEGLFEGESGSVAELIRWCHRGPSEAEVTEVREFRENYTGEYQDFVITY
jgi:acylphosphatase